MLGNLAGSITAHFSFANYTAQRRRELLKLFSRMAFVMMLVCIPLLYVCPYLTALFGVTSLMLAVLAGGVDVSDRILTRKEGRLPCRFQVTAKTYVSQTHAYTHAYTRNRARSHRSASRSTFSRNAKDNSDSGDSDSGDPPSPPPLPSVTPISLRTKQPNRSFFPWQRPGCWRMAHEAHRRGCVA